MTDLTPAEAAGVNIASSIDPKVLAQLQVWLDEHTV